MSPADSHIGDEVGTSTEVGFSPIDPDSSSSEEHHHHHHHHHRHRRRTSHGRRKVALRYGLIALLYVGAIVIGLLVWFKLT